MIAESDEWLATIFRRPVFKVRLSDASTPERLVPDAVMTSTPAFYYAKVPTQRVADVATLTRLGFAVVDVSVTLERPASAFEEPGRGNGIVVRESEPRDTEAIVAIAGASFVYSRFHLDPQVPDEVANAVKRAWAGNYCAGRRGHRVLVAERGQHVAGFVAELRLTHGGRRGAVIDLLAVHRDWQRRGVGRALVEGFIRAAGHDVDVLRVGTQAANVPSIGLYEACGFRVVETSYVLHAHT